MIIWTDKAIEAFWRAMPAFKDNLSKKQTIAILDAAIKAQGIEDEVKKYNQTSSAICEDKSNERS